MFITDFTTPFERKPNFANGNVESNTFDSNWYRYLILSCFLLQFFKKSKMNEKNNKPIKMLIKKEIKTGSFKMKILQWFWMMPWLWNKNKKKIAASICVNYFTRLDGFCLLYIRMREKAKRARTLIFFFGAKCEWRKNKCAISHGTEKIHRVYTCGWNGISQFVISR